jgi:ERCC4-type nuclease
MPIIKIDDRECNEILLATLRQEKDAIIKFCRLPVGDYQVENHLLVERKTISDLTVSIKDGRWFQQALKLSSLPIQSIVILEGTSMEYRSVGMKREAIQGALITLSLLFKIPLLRSKTPEETARLIMYAARQIAFFGCHTGNIRHPPSSRPLKNKYKRKLHVLQGLPGIGPGRAKLLLDKFGTIKGIINALPEEWEEIPGIGKTISRKINQVLDD